MNARRPLFARLALFVGAACLAHGAAPVGAQLFQDTNTRIDDLFGHRNTPPKPPGPRDNPFRPVEIEVVVAPKDPNNPSKDPVVVANPNESPDETLLRQAYGRLTFGGLIKVGDRTMVVINKATYKEGGLLTVRVQGQDVYLRIITLTDDTITLGLNEARLTLHF